MPGRVLLISTNRYASPYPVFPLGLAYLDRALRQAGHPTQWLDLLVQGNCLREVIRSFRPDFVGLSLRNIDDVLIRQRATFFADLRSFCAGIRTLSDAPLVLGGSGFSIFPRELLELSGADLGIQGEGEESLVTLLRCLESRRDYSGIPGLVFRRDGQTISNPPRRLAEPATLDMPALPDALVRYYLQHSSMLSVQTQRGCRFHCAYCTYPLIEGNMVRRRAPASVVDELSQLHRRGARYVFIVDSVFNSSPQHVTGICEEILRRGLKIQWGCFLRPQHLGADLMRLMAAAGLSHIEFGSDSFCDEVLAAYGKRLTFDDILKTSELAAREKIDFCHFLICGGPGETEATLQTSYQNSALLPEGVIMPVVGMRVYPGTPLHTMMRQERGEAAEADLLTPHYYLSPGLSEATVFNRLEEFARRSPNWIVGEPPRDYLQVAERLRQRGVVGPLWSYARVLRRLTPANASRGANP